MNDNTHMKRFRVTLEVINVEPSGERDVIGEFKRAVAEQIEPFCDYCDIAFVAQEELEPIERDSYRNDDGWKVQDKVAQESSETAP